MARFTFMLCTDGDVREAGWVVSDSFDDAMTELTRQHRPSKGDTLEIGVAGFPPARYEHTGTPWGVRGWRPAGLMAA